MAKDLRFLARRIQRQNPKNNTRDCISCGCMETVYGRLWCNAIGGYKTKDYECPKKTEPFTVKVCELFMFLNKEKKITNIEWCIDGEIGYITGFGYTDIITPNNIDMHMSNKDKYYEKWYCRWVDAFSDELLDNRNDNSGGY